MFLDLKTEDRENRGVYEMASGLWPRFSHYEIREKDGRQFICPGKGATLEKYDPWETQNKFRLNQIDNCQSSSCRDSRPPYILFLAFLEELAVDCFDNAGPEDFLLAKDPKLSAKQFSTLCDWCGRHGLLGILFHQVKMFRLPYIDRRPEGNMYKSIAYYKKQGKWLVNDFRFKAKQQQSQKALSASFLDWKTGRVELESYSSSALFSDQDEKFDWSDPHWIAENYFPFSEDFMETMTTGAWEDVWRSYCEPIDFFWNKVALLGRSLRFLGQRHRADWYEKGVHGLNMLIGESPAYYGLRKGKVIAKFRTPSLLSAYSLMALDDAAGGAHCRQCENEKCRRWFTSKHVKAKFCSPGCNTVQQQRKSRRRKKEVENAGHQGLRVCRGCGASMAGKRPQAMFCTTTCGNTFRKREQRAKKARRL